MGAGAAKNAKLRIEKLKDKNRIENSGNAVGNASSYWKTDKAPFPNNLIKNSLANQEAGAKDQSSSFFDNTELRRFDMYAKKDGDTTSAVLKDQETELSALLAENLAVADNEAESFQGNPRPKLTPDLGTVHQERVEGMECPIENVLHDYEPVNYIITLSALSKQAFNDGGGPETVIFKSGGKGTQGTGNLAFDYYVDNLTIRNSVAPNEQTASGAIYQILFQVTEPFGTSFVDALIQAAKQQGYADHLKAVYNLRIEFKGNNSEGQATESIPYSTRDIPIHIYSVVMNVEAGVSSYQLQCVPATYLTQTDLYGITQATVTCSGDTVGDIIENFMDNYTKEVSTLQSSSNQIVKPGMTDIFVLDRDNSMADIIKSKINYTTNSSLVNNYTVSNLDLPITQNLQRIVTVPKGTKIITFIENIVKSSRFYRDQFEGNRPKGPELVTLKTETQLRIGEDNGNGRDQYTFVYILREQKFTADIMDGSIDTEYLMNPVRTYNYLYTGENKDVLDFNIEYQFAYYQAIPYKPDQGSESTDAQSGAEEGDNATDQTKKNQIETFANEPINSGSGEFIPGVNDSNGQIVDIFQQIIMNPSADLLVTQLNIIGDPYWLPQKTVSNQAFANTFTGCTNTDTRGAIATDESQVIINLNFKTPVDLDDDTGLFKNLNDTQGFQGFYRVYMCEHRFEAGIYTNILQMVRVKNQKKETRVDSNLTNDTIIKEKGVPGESYDFAHEQPLSKGVVPEGVNGVTNADDTFVGITDMTNVSSDNVNKLPVNTSVYKSTNIVGPFVDNTIRDYPKRATIEQEFLLGGHLSQETTDKLIKQYGENYAEKLAGPPEVNKDGSRIYVFED